MRFGVGQKAQRVGVVALAMSFALAGCGSGSKLGGAQAAEDILPPRESMPTELRTVTDEPSSRAKAPKKCSVAPDKPSGWCKGAVAVGDAAYGSSDKSKSARFNVVVYRSDYVAKKAFRKWESYAQSSPTKYRTLKAETFGSGSVAFADVDPAYKDHQELVIREANFIGTVKYDGSRLQDAVDPTLLKLSKMFTERMRQEG
ncbi:hypothetical protein [Streptomyces halobius]|uniref:Lipoprotein n=1 Tax=Streptomyces halobius TaxID=2879846 RepID=A0ABY4M7G1_9ACTN|nr:hypothetical protein [Streptomyces halobius]UQA92759.1 hypothetical protein K9S39_13810 [Streptomyces halobius]